jgi:superfamily II DNA/RNA helicase
MLFSELKLPAHLLEILDSISYKLPTPIQEKAIPILLNGLDLLASAQTGTGKTAAYCLPLLNYLHVGKSKPKMPRAITLVPTRELAAQVVSELEKFSSAQKFKVVQVIGGESMMEQEKALMKMVDVIVATPGRLLDFLSKGKLILNEVKFFVLDEADKMLDMGFLDDVEKIMGYLPKSRQTALFSATFSNAILNLSKKLLNLPQEIMISPCATTASTVTQYFVNTCAKGKAADLKELLKRENITSSIIFCNRKRDIQGLLKEFEKWGYKVGALHGDLTQQVRTQTWPAFKDSEIQFLIASDVAARGLDSEGLDVVVNYDVPNSSDDYVHRIGRTGRAGKEGKSYTLCMSTDRKTVAEIEKIIKTTLNYIVLDDKKKSEVVAKKEDITTPTPSKRPARKAKPKKEESAIEPVISNQIEILETPKKPPASIHLNISNKKALPRSRVREPKIESTPKSAPVIIEQPKIPASTMPKPRPNKDGHIILIEEQSVNKKGFGDIVPSFMKAVWVAPQDPD